MHRRVALIINTQGSRCGLCRKPVYHDVSTRCPNCNVEFAVLQVSDQRYATKFPRLRWRLPVEIRGRSQSVAGAVRRNGVLRRERM